MCTPDGPSQQTWGRQGTDSSPSRQNGRAAPSWQFFVRYNSCGHDVGSARGGKRYASVGGQRKSVLVIHKHEREVEAAPIREQELVQQPPPARPPLPQRPRLTKRRFGQPDGQARLLLATPYLAWGVARGQVASIAAECRWRRHTGPATLEYRQDGNRLRQRDRRP